MLWLHQAGIPQGGIISPAIANWALDGLQRQLTIVFGPPRWIGGKQVIPKINFVRCADDFKVTGPSKEVLENEVRPVIGSFLRERGLLLSPERTRVTHISEGFDFLGQNVRKYSGKLLIKPSKKNVQAFLTKIRSIINENRTAKQQNLIGLLNPVIKGWADYHRHAVSKRVFARVDSEIWRVLWQWCCRRHSNKGRHWVKHRYFRCIGTRDWIFAAETGERWPDGKPVVTTLRYAAAVPILSFP
ncbi:group II intron maturase-specific domain-containing protein [Paraburkholderia azotifigens]|uniref:group II intron maturase-specific domain-containing protein n=1 Tax=Paraburkholderia azotifigens TaxID=2057004 RepID=UPI0031774654